MLYDFLVRGPETSAGQAMWQQFDRLQKNKFLLAHEKIADYKVEACQGKIVIIVKGFVRFSLKKRLESLPVHSRLLNLDL